MWITLDRFVLFPSWLLNRHLPSLHIAEFWTKSNETRYLLVNATTRRDEDNNIVGVVGVAQASPIDRFCVLLDRFILLLAPFFLTKVLGRLQIFI